jgi:hypothetical protein
VILIVHSKKSFNSAPVERVKPLRDKIPAAELTFYTISTQPQLRTRTQRAILFSRRAHRTAHTHAESLKSRQSRSIKRRQCFYFTADLFFYLATIRRYYDLRRSRGDRRVCIRLHGERTHIVCM